MHEATPRHVSLDDVTARYSQADAVMIEDRATIRAAEPGRCAIGPLVFVGAAMEAPIHRLGVIEVDNDEPACVPIATTETPGDVRARVHQADGAVIFNHPEFPLPLHRISLDLPG